MKFKKLKMKNTKLLITAVMVFIIILSVYFFPGCSKQNDKVNQESKTGSTQQQNITDNSDDTSMDMNHGDMNMEMSKENIQHEMVNIPTAQCVVCKENITKALNKVKGIQSFKVDIDGKVVHINFDKTVTNINKIENTITMAGYAANDKKADPEAYSKLDDCCKLPEDRKNKK